MSTCWQAAIPGGSGEKRKDMQRGRDRLMEWWYEKLTRSVCSFDKMPINQSLSPVNLNPFLSQAFSFARIHPLSRLPAAPRPVFLSRPPVSLFNGSVTLTPPPPPPAPRPPPFPFSSLWFPSLFFPLPPLCLTLLLCPSLFLHLPHASILFRIFFFFLPIGRPLSPLPPDCLSPSLSLCYVCCLAALSFTCQLGSGLWSSNMTNCPLIHLHARRHTRRSAHTCSVVFSEKEPPPPNTPLLCLFLILAVFHWLISSCWCLSL